MNNVRECERESVCMCARACVYVSVGVCMGRGIQHITNDRSTHFNTDLSDPIDTTHSTAYTTCVCGGHPCARPHPLTPTLALTRTLLPPASLSTLSFTHTHTHTHTHTLSLTHTRTHTHTHTPESSAAAGEGSGPKEPRGGVRLQRCQC